MVARIAPATNIGRATGARFQDDRAGDNDIIEPFRHRAARVDERRQRIFPPPGRPVPCQARRGTGSRLSHPEMKRVQFDNSLYVVDEEWNSAEDGRRRVRAVSLGHWLGFGEKRLHFSGVA